MEPKDTLVAPPDMARQTIVVAPVWQVSHAIACGATMLFCRATRTAAAKRVMGWKYFFGEFSFGIFFKNGLKLKKIPH